MVRPARGLSLVKPGRWWLSLAYVLATLLAMVGHDHARETAPPWLEAAGDCDDSRPHLGSHPADASPSGSADCPSCHFRAQYPLAEFAPRPVSGPGLAIPPESGPASTLPGSPLRTRCRAPPRG